MNAESNRIPYIDSIKGFTILLVVFGHVLRKYYSLDLYPAYTPYFKLIHDVIYSFHMPLFMMISGYLFHRSYFSSDGTIKIKRLKTHWLDLAIVYTFFSLIVGVAKLLFQNDVLDPIVPLDLALIWIKPIGFLWYLHVLLVLYIINYLIFKWSRRNLFRRILILILAVLLHILFSISSFETGIIFHISRIIIYEFYFYFGSILEMGSVKCLLLIKHHIPLYVMASILLPIKLHTNSDPFPGADLIIAVGLGFLISDLIRIIPLLSSSSPLQYFGMICFEIYLLHQFPVTFFQKLLPKLPITNPISSVLLNFGLSIILTSALVLVAKRTHLHHFLLFPYTTFTKTKHA